MEQFSSGNNARRSNNKSVYFKEEYDLNLPISELYQQIKNNETREKAASMTGAGIEINDQSMPSKISLDDNLSKISNKYDDTSVAPKS